MADRIATYDRIPTSDPAVLAALARRRSALTAWIDQQPGGLVYVRAYLDRDVSGNAQVQQRPALRRLLADARKHTFSLLLVNSLERLGRSPNVLLEILAALEPTEITIRSLSPHEPPETLTRGQLVAHLRRLANFSPRPLAKDAANAHPSQHPDPPLHRRTTPAIFHRAARHQARRLHQKPRQLDPGPQIHRQQKRRHP